MQKNQARMLLLLLSWYTTNTRLFVEVNCHCEVILELILHNHHEEQCTIYHLKITFLPEIFRTELVTLYACCQCNVALSSWCAIHSNGTEFLVVIANIISKTRLQRCSPWLSYCINLRWSDIRCLFAKVIISTQSTYYSFVNHTDTQTENQFLSGRSHSRFVVFIYLQQPWILQTFNSTSYLEWQHMITQQANKNNSRTNIIIECLTANCSLY